jgi:dTDP-4-amino-4,6-dideoxy-D-galactose acyltransferase
MQDDLDIEILNWDTDFFGFRVGRLYLSSVGPERLISLCETMTTKKINVTYIIVKEWNLKLHDQLLNAGAILTDRKITYSKDVVSNASKTRSTFPLIDIKNKSITKDIIALAYESGLYSRFLKDSGFGRLRFEKLYYEWLEKSVHGKLADHVWAAYNGAEVIGFVTAREEITEKTGHIGLIAVSEKYRGKKIGHSLIEKCDEWFLTGGMRKAKVVTQGENIGACKFYESSGYQVESTDYYYHLWNHNFVK